MKKIFYYIIAVVMIVYLAIVPAVAADEGGESFDGGDVVTEVYETVYETVGETAGETGGAVVGAAAVQGLVGNQGIGHGGHLTFVLPLLYPKILRLSML